MTLSEWADEHFYLSAESAAEPGRWRTLPYQRGILDAISDRSVVRVSVMKSARVGYTKCVNAAVAYHIHHDPCPIMVVQPTVEDAEGYSKEEIAPMLRDVPVLAERVGEQKARASGQTILDKSFPGGKLGVVGANSGRGFRRTSRRLVIFDEVDGYPTSAGSDGDPIKLGERRSEYYWNRKIVAGSTPLLAGSSRIEELFEAGDRRRYYVPCPHCGHMDYLRFGGRVDDTDKPGHWLHWDEGKPELAHFVCRACGCAIEETHKRAMLEAGEWRAEGEFKGHASFHIWAAYSLSPNASWGQLAVEFLEAKRGGPEQLKTYVNTVLGETWKERGEAPDWERLHARREMYKIGTVPDGVLVLTAGVDVQKDRFVYEIVGWAANKESWSIEIGELFGDTSKDATWRQLDELLARGFPGADGLERTITSLAIDSGYNTQTVYGWARGKPNVIAIKGVEAGYSLLGSPSKVDVKINGQRVARGYRVWPVCVSIAKAELYGFLGIKLEEGEAAPAGYCHFPEYGPEFFKQLTAEHLVKVTNKKTRATKHEWHVLPNRENHYLDARIYARAAVARLGLDRMKKPKPKAPAPSISSVAPPPAVAPVAPAAVPPVARAPRAKKANPFAKGGSWFGKRR